MVPTVAQITMAAGMDALINVEVGGRGVVSVMHAAARDVEGGPLCLAAADRLLRAVRRRDVVVLATGLPIPPWFRGEQDGPVGAATLARALVLGVGACPVIVTEPANVALCTAALGGAGLYVGSLEEARRLPTTAAVLDFPVDWAAADARAAELLGSLAPAALIAIERPGANEHGHYHSAGGRPLTEHCAKIDALFRAGRAREILSVGVGDGGNELGCAKIRDAVLRVAPRGGRCVCPCGGTVVPVTETDVLVTAAISNWGAYGIEAAMAMLLGRPEVLHTRELDARVYDRCAAAGGNDADAGLLDPGADGVPGPLHGHMVDLLACMVRNALDFGKMYREPRYPWL